MIETSLKVPSIACDACARSIKNSLSRLSGIDGIEVDVNSKIVKFKYDEAKISLDDIKRKLDDIGYTVT